MGNLERITFIDRRIREQGGVKLAEIVRRFEVSERQAKRDLEYLRDRLDAPIAWDASSRRYVYEEDWNDLAFADQKSLLFYVFARAAAGTL
ncbi:MAG: WYL domain-containing protein, partial [Treponema sp.]|nr:WYL domain-containing protein [Treponema sp.]